MIRRKKKLTERRWFHAHEIPRVDQLNGLELASFKRRAWAFLIDAVLSEIVKSPIAAVGFFIHPHWMERTSVGGLLEHAGHEIESIAGSILYFGVLLKLMRGQTPGKWLMKIRVLSLTAHDITWWQSIERALGYGASLLEAGTGFLQYFINRNRMCVHDRIAETIVIYEGKDAIRAAPPERTEPAEGLPA